MILNGDFIQFSSNELLPTEYGPQRVVKRAGRSHTQQNSFTKTFLKKMKLKFLKEKRTFLQ